MLDGEVPVVVVDGSLVGLTTPILPASFGVRHMLVEATDLASIQQHDQEVVVLLRPRDGGRERTIRARYLIAVDRARSFLRRQLGI